MEKKFARRVSVDQSAPELASKLISACEETKGVDIMTLDVRGISDISDFFIVASGRSDRHVQGIARKVLEALERAGRKPISVEGFEKGHWVVIDTGDVVLHLFYEPVRSHYNLEGLWTRAKRVEIKRTSRPPKLRVLQAA